jgi:transketolase C-terminal domain/subunit
MQFIGMPDTFAVVGPTNKVRAKYGMSAESIEETCRQMLGHR